MAIYLLLARFIKRKSTPYKNMKSNIQIILALVLTLTGVSCSSTQQRSNPQQCGPQGQMVRQDDCAHTISSPAEVRDHDGHNWAKVKVGNRHFAANPGFVEVKNNRTGEKEIISVEELQRRKAQAASAGHTDAYQTDGTHPAFRDLNKNPMNPFTFK